MWNGRELWAIARCMRVLVAKQQEREKRWTPPCCIIIELEERDCEEFHVFGYGKNFCGIGNHVGDMPRGAKDRSGRTALWHLHKEELLAFFRFGDMSRHKWVLHAREGGRAFGETAAIEQDTTDHEGFEVGPPPLGKTIADFPVIVNPMGSIELARVTRGC